MAFFHDQHGFEHLLRLLRNEETESRVPIELFYALPILSVEEYSKQFDYSDILKACVEALLKRLRLLDEKELKEFNIILYYQVLLFQNAQVECLLE